MRIFHPAARAASFELLPKVEGGCTCFRHEAPRDRSSVDTKATPAVLSRRCVCEKDTGRWLYIEGFVWETTRCIILLVEIKRANLMGHRWRFLRPGNTKAKRSRWILGGFRLKLRAWNWHGYVVTGFFSRCRDTGELRASNYSLSIQTVNQVYLDCLWLVK